MPKKAMIDLGAYTPLSQEERYTIVEFLRHWVEQRFELMAENAVRYLDKYKIRSLTDDCTIKLSFNINLPVGYLKLLLDGELAPRTAAKLFSEGQDVDTPYRVHLDADEDIGRA
jgi:hypothetical protein